MKIRGIEVDVPVKEILEEFTWERATWSEERLICNSPFRRDSHPSFFVRLKPFGDLSEGVWADSGAVDEHWASGSFPRLYAWLKGVTEDEAEEYLLETYAAAEIGYTSQLTLKVPTLKLKESRQYIPESKLLEFEHDFSYLNSRNIPSHIAKQCEVYYDKERKAIAIPWKDSSGRICNMKYRRVDSKVFWYEKGYAPISQLIYGIDGIYRSGAKEAVVTEAEIDAMTMMRVFPAIALGGSNFSERKAEIIIRSPIQHLIIATDNDAVGRKMARQIALRLGNYMKISLYVFPDGVKDVNEIEDDEGLMAGILAAKPMKRFTGLKL